ncbi:unnamed protein product [Brassicogethes aeneus]|uniref:Nose resistant-to-fluoxetine protein N-terminal domain-containing protein n=1 Tax=Brassicogethes aeneus TaxID=1431903 RepID=A0A9P0B8R5_BRAAE|nr:unnamed protein product [Brassicogethes aeneus]
MGTLGFFVFFLVLVNFSANAVLEFDKYVNILQNTEGVSQKCLDQINSLDLETKVKMFDASSKLIYPGMLQTYPVDMGMYDECIALDFTNKSTRTLGKHCVLVGTTLSIPTSAVDLFKHSNNVVAKAANINATQKFFKISAGYCVPDQCSKKDLDILFKQYELGGVVTFNFSNAVCTTKETGKELDAWDFGFITLLAIIGCLIIINTTYDIYQDWFSLPKQNVLIAFSLYTNAQKLVHIGKSSKEQIQVFHGLKFISMMWIIAGHGFVAFRSLPVINPKDVLAWNSNIYSQYITAAHLAVDTFFYISGFLLPYIYIKMFKGKDFLFQLKSVPMSYVHRYIRLTPALAMMYLYTITLMRRIGGGPIYDKNVNAFVTSCRKNALSFFFYYQNYYNYDDLCMTQTWYLSADMQMFWLSPIILLPTAYFVTKKYKAVMLSLISFSIFTVILPMIIKFIYQDYKNDYDTHSRLCNYIIGFTFGVFMRENIDKPFIFKKNKYLKNFLLWCIALGSMYVLVYLNGWIYIGNGTYAGKTVIESLMRPIWCLGLTWIVYSCFHGYGGVVNWILTRPILQFGSRLSYCMYLMHGSVIAHNVMMFRQKEIFSDWREFYLWCGYLIVTLMVALVWSLAFESPIIILEKVIFGASGKKKEHPTPPAKKTIQA